MWDCTSVDAPSVGHCRPEPTGSDSTLPMVVMGVRARAFDAHRNDGESWLQINFRFYLPFIWRPCRRHECKASLIALLKPSLEGPHASFHARFTCCNCAHLGVIDGFAVDGPDRPARRQIRQDGSRSESARRRLEDGARRQNPKKCPPPQSPPPPTQRWRPPPSPICSTSIPRAPNNSTRCRESARRIPLPSSRAVPTRARTSWCRRISCRKRPMTASRTRSSPSRRAEAIHHCERSEAIHNRLTKTGLLRRFAPRNDV